MAEEGGPAGAAPEDVSPDLQSLVEQQRSAFAARFGRPPDCVASAPGRINVIGEHTDYNHGLALPGAIDRWIVVTLARRAGGGVAVHSEAFDETVELGTELPTGPMDAPDWAAIPRGAVELLRTANVKISGANVMIGGNLPRGAGVASSAAVEMALLNGLRATCDAAIDDLELVRLAQRIEHEFLGVRTGLMDQYTAQFARPGAVMLIDFDDFTHRDVPVLLEGWTWLLLDTGVRHELAASAYGERVAQMRAALARIAEVEPAVASFRQLHEPHADLLDDPVLRGRVRHYVGENERVQAAAGALAGGDVAALGALLLASHASLRDDYQVSCTELDVLADTAARVEGCAGARMMGGGFGGCTLNLVHADAVDAFVAEVSPAFERRFGRRPPAAEYRLVGGARLHHL